jgi:hypothetical protein
VFWINVPVGCAAVIAGRYLLPRTRQRGRGGRFDWQGLVLLGASTSALLLAASVIAGLELPSWSVPVLLGVAAGAAIGFWRWEGRVPSALIDTALLRNRVVTAGLAGALGGYLVLFGPLVSIPQVLVAGGTGELVAGLVLTALPAGFAASALMGDHLLPRAWGDRRRCVTGAMVAAAGCALLAADPVAEGWAGACLALTGAGLGLFVPANNTVVMGAVPERVSATAGGMVNMARGIGTALGIAAVTLALHLAGGSHEAGARAAPAVLAAVALLAGLTASGRVVRPGAGPYPGRS